MNHHLVPNWGKNDPEEYFNILKGQMQAVHDTFPDFAFQLDGSILYIEGKIMIQGNKVIVRLYYPPNFPAEKVIPVVFFGNMSLPLVQQESVHWKEYKSTRGIEPEFLYFDAQEIEMKSSEMPIEFLSQVLIWLS